MAKKAQEFVYIAQTPVWSMQHGKEFQPGEEIPFDLGEEAPNKPNIDRLVAIGALKQMTRQEFEASQAEAEAPKTEIIIEEGN